MLVVEVGVTSRVKDELEAVSLQEVVGKVELGNPRALLVRWEHRVETYPQSVFDHAGNQPSEKLAA